MGDLWEFISKPENRELVAWLGSGLCVAAGGIWTMVKYFTAPSASLAPKHAPPPLASGRDGIVGGGDISIDSGTTVSNQFKAYGGQQNNAPGGTQYIGTLPDKTKSEK